MDSIGKQIYDVLYSMRLAPRHQLEQAANEIAKLFSAPPAPAVPDLYRKAVLELADRIDEADEQPIQISRQASDAIRALLSEAPEPAPVVPEEMLKYIQHNHWCISWDGNDCDCGFEESLVRWNAATPEREGT